MSVRAFATVNVYRGRRSAALAAWGRWRAVSPRADPAADSPVARTGTNSFPRDPREPAEYLNQNQNSDPCCWKVYPRGNHATLCEASLSCFLLCPILLSPGSFSLCPDLSPTEPHPRSPQGAQLRTGEPREPGSAHPSLHLTGSGSKGS